MEILSPQSSPTAPGPSLVVSATVADVANLSESIAASRFRPASSQLHLVRWCCSLLRTLFPSLPVTAFGPNKLRQVQQAMVEHGLSRGEVNRRVSVVRRVFRTGVAHELVPVAVLESLRCLEPLHMGWTKAHETESVAPVAEDVWRCTLAHMSPTIRTMVQVQAVTGMRTGELVAMTVGEIDRSSLPWLYLPGKHKNTWRKKKQKRVIPLGPKAREILGPLLEGLEPHDHVFSPRRELARLSAERRAKRKTPLWPSHVRPRASNPKRAPSDRYTTQSYARAVARARKRGSVDRWRPYQLRHSKLTDVSNRHGLEAAAAVAGHASVATVQIYTRVNVERAKRLAEELG